MFVFVTSLNELDYPGRIPRGQDFIDTTQNYKLSRLNDGSFWF